MCYYYYSENGPYEPYSEQISGNFSMTYITIGSAFEDISTSENYYSKAFEEKGNREKFEYSPIFVFESAD